MKLVKLNARTMINPETVAYVTTIMSEDLSLNELRERLSIEDLERLGFPVRKRDEFIYCSSWDEARAEVKKNPTTCKISHGCEGYLRLESGEKDLVEKYTVYKDGEFETVNTSIPKGIVVGFKLHLMAPSGGINYGHSIIEVTPSEFEIFMAAL